MHKSDLYVVEIDETKFWVDSFIKENKINQITTVYVLDKGQQTRCCEWTPSYWLEPLYKIVDPIDAYDAVELSAQAEDYDGMYMHCHEIDSMSLIKIDQDFEYDENNEEDNEVGYYNQLNQAIDHLRGNHPI